MKYLITIDAFTALQAIAANPLVHTPGKGGTVFVELSDDTVEELRPYQLEGETLSDTLVRITALATAKNRSN